MKKVNSMIEMIGNTPLVEVSKTAQKAGAKGHVYAKLERTNPGGSVKDRVALAMINDAEAKGILKPGGTIIEPTSGNTGIGLAWVGRAKGYNVILTMPDSMSVERRNLLKAYGATLVLTPGAEGMKGSMAKAEELQKETPNSVILGQFSNPANPAIHEQTTGPEIWNDTDGMVDIFVAGVGTGGTITGVGRALKKRNPNVKIIAVEPSDSAVLSGGNPGPHKIQGIGAGFIPDNYDASVIDEVVSVTNEDAAAASRMLAENESILAGISSGAAMHVALQLAADPDNASKTIVALLPDNGERYLSTGLFD